MRDTAFVFGGRAGYAYLGEKYYGANDVGVFNATRSEWIQTSTRGSVGPLARSGAAVQVLNERLLFVHGGYDEHQAFDDTWLLDTRSMQFVELPNPMNEKLKPTARESHASAVVGQDTVLVYGGDSEAGGFCGDLQIFDGMRYRWVGSPAAVGYSPGARTGAAMAAMDDTRVLLTGGSNGFCSESDYFTLDTTFASAAQMRALKQEGLTRGPDAESCVVCLDSACNALFSCGHIVTCLRCAKKCDDTCPVCRAVVTTQALAPQLRR
jgi:N-acetylneuraminic acid mutarotase